MKKLLLIPAICGIFVLSDRNFAFGEIPAEQINQTIAQSSSPDWEITLKVKEALLADSELSASNRFISVATTNGVVTLTGTVTSKVQMKKIVKKVKSVPGVVRVDNELTVVPKKECKE